MRGRVAGAALLLSLAPAALTAEVVVDEVESGFAADEAGLRPGDLLDAWERAAAPPANPEPAQGSLRSPFDLAWVEREQAPRGELTLRGTREGGPLLVRVPAGEWRVEARPVLEGANLQAYAGGQWNELASALGAAGDHAAASWLFVRQGRRAARQRAWDDADRAFAAAGSEAGAAGDPLVTAFVHSARGRYSYDRARWDDAVAAYGLALTAYRALLSPGLGEAWIHNHLGRVATRRGDLAGAEAEHRLALALRERVAPGSADVAGSHLNLGNVARMRGDLEASWRETQRAQAVYEGVGLQFGVSSALNNLALVASERGDSATEEEYLRRALAVDEPRRGHSIEVANTLHNLGIVTKTRGDWIAAEDYFQRSLAMTEALGASLDAANTLHSLGILAWSRGDLTGAEDYYTRALAIRESLAPQSVEVSHYLQSLGHLAVARDETSTAEEYFRRALEIRERLSPGSLLVATSLNSLGKVYASSRETERARAYFQRALAMAEPLAARGPQVAYALQQLGELALAEGDLEGAESLLNRSLEMERESKGAARVTEVYQRLATVHRRRGERAKALALLEEALRAVESQHRTVGGTDEAKTRFAARAAWYYRESIDLLVELGRAEEAFHVLERYRARGLLAMLAERDLVFSADVPPDLDAARRMANAEYERTVARLASATAANVGPLRDKLADIRRRQATVQDRIRAASPRLAALQYPQPLDLAATRAALDPGTVVLSYLVGEGASYVFAVGPGPADFAAKALAVTPGELRADVERFRALAQEPLVLRRRELDRLGRRLADVLLAPVKGAIARAARVLVVPDGPLHRLPFAALADPASPPGRRYLVEAKPVHVAASVTVFAELRRERRPDRAARLVAFGDPDYSAVATARETAAPAVRQARERGLDFRPLPGSRAEVDGLKALFSGSSRVYVGPEATEDKAKAIGGDASLVHFACHGLADESSPLDSALALTAPADWRPGRENGLLQAWEIFEQVRLDADLVTLSACNSGLGKEASGEGLLGLTRAFQYAGARSVLASLWRVGDDSTEELMGRFYRHLKQGKSKGEALQAAQAEMIRRPATSHPYRWAAFQLSGDWR